ncbi:MAG TPA: TetR/AcrR family transcriptional regulator [Gemmatimonadales bacterium]|nr:TetR/AcrR family transcriptional regulator [Gemmatimonadales bacterium]
MARTPGSTREQTHERIVGVAARALRRDGYAGTGVAAVMKEAGLTHGGFYAHFDSRDDLLIEAFQQAGKESRAIVAEAIEAGRARGTSPFRALVETYLDDRHLTHLEIGCPIAALGCDMPRQSSSVRKASARGVQQLIEAVRATLPSRHKDAAGPVASALVGSLQLGRALGNSAEGRAHLAAARKALIDTYA